MNNLADIANGLVIITEQGDDASPTELLSILQYSAKQCEEPTSDIEQVNQLITEIDTEAIHEKLPTDGVGYDEERLDDILGELSEETRQIQSAEDALNFDFGAANEVVDGFDVVDDGKTRLSGHARGSTHEPGERATKLFAEVKFFDTHRWHRVVLH